MTRNLKVYFSSQSRNVHDIVPQTYIISVGEHTSDYTEFIKHIKALEAKAISSQPNADSKISTEIFRGRGIRRCEQRIEIRICRCAATRSENECISISEQPIE